MKTPSKSQQKAVLHLSGPAMVIAGPGSGKTFTIIERILTLIRVHHIPPERILVITYTKAAANEMKERYEKAHCPPGSASFGTFHSICYNILKRSGAASANSLINEKDKRKLLQVILSNQKMASRNNSDALNELQNEISRMKNLPCADASYSVASSFFSGEELCLIRSEYDRHLREQGLIDFDDMILECFRLLSSREEVLRSYQELFQYILADEFQDINPLQYEILKLLSLPRNNLFVVGDDDQAIYGFRGASPGIMKQFAADYPDAEVIRLTENYRSGDKIVALGDEMISRNKERFPKSFRPVKKGGEIVFACFDSRKEQESQLIRELSALRQEERLRTALITRTNRDVMLYASLLKENRIAVKDLQIRRENLFHSFIMQDTLSFLCFLYEGRKRHDFMQFMNRPNLFLTREALPFETVREEHLERYYRHNPDMLSIIRRIFQEIAIAEKLPPHLAVSFFRRTWGYDGYLKERGRDSGDFKALMAQADKVQQLFQGFSSGAPLRKFVEEKAMEESAPALQKEKTEGVSILTMHGSKGLEFDRVFLPDVNEGIIPPGDCRLPDALEEERRLLYVAITRARDHLYIYYTRERNRKPSRYLEGLIRPSCLSPAFSPNNSYSSSSSITSSSNSTLSRYSSNASDTISYSSSSSI